MMSNRGNSWRFVLAESATILLILLSAAFALSAPGISGRSGYFPLAVALITTALGILALVVAWYSKRTTDSLQGEAATDLDAAASETKLAFDKQMILLIFWFVTVLASTYMLGLVVASALASAVYFLVVMKYRLFRSTVYGLLLGFSIRIIFGEFAGLPLYQGLF